MAEIDKLTARQRSALESGMCEGGREALRIIDRLTEALAEQTRTTIGAQRQRADAEARVRELDYANEQRRLVIDTLEGKLAAADALLERWIEDEDHSEDGSVRSDTRGHLSNQPVVVGAFWPCGCPWLKPGTHLCTAKPAAPTDYDRAVLDAMAGARIVDDGDGTEPYFDDNGSEAAVCEAELARREAKR